MNQNISQNYINCPLCKNIFLKTHIKIHYQNCKKKNEKKNQNEKKEDIEKKEKREENERKEQTDRKYVKDTRPQMKIQMQNQTQHPQPLEENKLQMENYISPQIVSYNDTMLNHFFKKYEQLFIEFITDKSVALVGPAQSIIGTKKGEIIDKFDLVVRLNKSIPLPNGISEDIGTRTDIVYNSLNTSDFPGENNLNPKLYKKYGVRFVCTSYPFNHNIFHDDIATYVYKYKFELPLKVMNDLKFRNFEKMLATRPYTGTCAIMDLLSYPIKYLYITGLDFYSTKYYSEYRRISKEGLKHNKNNIIHQCKPQIDYLKHISFFDDRIILDQFLDKLLYHDYYKVVKHLMAIDKNHIFKFSDPFFQQYFEMKLSHITYTKEYFNKKDKNIDGDNNNTYLIFTDNKYFKKEANEYCIFITNEKQMLNMLNSNLTTKKFIGNFYYNENKANPATLFFSEKYLNNIKHILTRVGIHNCNVNLAIMLALFLYNQEKHFFSKNEVLNGWKLTMEEKKLVLFMVKKKLLNLY
jgi:hypothetical protein